MLVNLHLDQVAIRAVVQRPDLFLRETHAVEDALRLAIETIGELLRIRKRAADALDRSGLAADISRCSPVPGREAALDPHRIADVEPMTGRGCIRRARTFHAHLGAAFLIGDSISSGTSKRARTS